MDRVKRAFKHHLKTTFEYKHNYVKSLSDDQLIDLMDVVFGNYRIMKTTLESASDADTKVLENEINKKMTYKD